MRPFFFPGDKRHVYIKERLLLDIFLGDEVSSNIIISNSSMVFCKIYIPKRI